MRYKRCVLRLPHDRSKRYRSGECHLVYLKIGSWHPGEEGKLKRGYNIMTRKVMVSWAQSSLLQHNEEYHKTQLQVLANNSEPTSCQALFPLRTSVNGARNLLGYAYCRTLFAQELGPHHKSNAHTNSSTRRICPEHRTLECSRICRCFLLVDTTKIIQSLLRP